MNATMTKQRRSTESTFEGLEEHDRLVAQAEEAPNLIQTERHAAAGDYSTARNKFRFSASLPVGERDAKQHGALLEEMTEAEKAASRSYWRHPPGCGRMPSG